MTSPTELLFGGGAPGAKFEHPGDTYQGRILRVEVRQATKYGTTEPDFWPKSGDPKMQLEIDLQTTLRDPQFEDDRGVRRIYIDSKRKKEALRDALVKVGVREPEVGGELSMTYTGDGESANGNRPPKLYEASYVKPSQNGASQVLGLTEPRLGVGTVTQTDPTPPLPTVGELDLAGLNPEAQAVIAKLLAKPKAGTEPPF